MLSGKVFLSSIVCDVYQSQDAVLLRIDHKGVKISQLDENHANIPSLLVFTDLGVCPEKKGSRYTDLKI